MSKATYTNYDILHKRFPSSMDDARANKNSTFVPTSNLSYLYHGYSMQVSLEEKASVYRILPYKPKPGTSLIYSKDNLELDSNERSRKRFIRIYPYENLYNKVNYDVSNVPHWIFHKKSLISRNVEVTGINDSPFSYYTNNGRLMLIFDTITSSKEFRFERDSVDFLGLGAVIDGVSYPSLGHMFTNSYNVASSVSCNRLYFKNTGRMCYGSLDSFLFKADDELPAYNNGTSYGWNTDLTSKLNISSLSSRVRGTLLQDMTFDTTSEFNMSRVNTSGLNSRITHSRDHYYLMLTSLGAYLRGSTPSSIKHPEKDTLYLYNDDLFLANRNNDIVVSTANYKMYSNASPGSQIISFEDLSNLSSSFEELVDQINARIDNQVFILDGLNVYNFIFDKVIDSLKFPQEIESEENEELKRIKKIILCHTAVRLASKLLIDHFNTIEECATKAGHLKELDIDLFKFLIKLTGKITDEIILKSVEECNEIAIALQFT